jgi:hypothetical protein
MEQVIYTQACGVPAGEAPVFITVVVRDERRRLTTQECHVFLPKEEIHLHKINYINDSGDDPALVTAGALRETHRLYAQHIISKGNPDCLTVDRSVCIDAETMQESPFYRFRLANQFSEAMWEIQAWTASSELRQTLSKLVRYKADPAEATWMSGLFKEAVGHGRLAVGHGRMDRL